MVQVAKVCLICFKLLKNEFAPIKNLIKDKIANLSDKLHSNINENSAMCIECLETVNRSFDFKIQCLETEAQLSPHISENDKIDLKFVSQGPDNQEIVLDVCRLCLNSVEMNSGCLLKELLENDVNFRKIFEEHIVNMNFEATAEPVVCEKCQKSILQFSNFLFLLENYESDKKLIIKIKEEEEAAAAASTHENLSEENKNNQVADNEDMMPDQGSNEENVGKGQQEEKIIIYNEDHNDDGFTTIEDDSSDDDFEEFVEKIAIEVVPNECDEDEEYLPKQKKGKTRRPKSKGTSDTKSEVSTDEHKRFICDVCGLKTKTKKYLMEHKKIHKHLENCPNWKPEILVDKKCEACEELRKVFMCEFCGYRTKVPSNFRLHMKASHHSSQDKVEEHCCELCSYKTPVKPYLFKHIRTMHQDPSQIVWYKCPFCDYKTKDKHFLSKHILLMHEEIDEKDMFQCEQCDFKAKAKESLKKHFRIKHSNFSEMETYCCDSCDYKTKIPIYLSRHKRNKHTDPTKLRAYECNLCSLKFKYSQTMKNHMLLKHKEEKEIYTCELCEFTATLPRYVKKHFIRIHEKPTRKTKSKKAVIHVISKKHSV